VSDAIDSSVTVCKTTIHYQRIPKYPWVFVVSLESPTFLVHLRKEYAIAY